MKDDVKYNQLIIFSNNASLKCKQVEKSFTEKDQLILIFYDSQKIIISGKNIDTTGHKKRVQELLLMANDDGLKNRENSVKHYAKVRDDEYVLVR